MNGKDSKIYSIEEIKKKSNHIFEKNDFVSKVYLFGSYARNEATDDSDLDFMVVMSPVVGFKFGALSHHLENEFNKDCDVITDYESKHMIPNGHDFDKEKVLIYERK